MRQKLTLGEMLTFKLRLHLVQPKRFKSVSSITRF